MSQERKDKWGRVIYTCKVCGIDTAMATQLCDGCWEFDSRLRYVLRNSKESYLEELLESIQEELVNRTE